VKSQVTISSEHAAALAEVERRTGILRFKLVALILSEALGDGGASFATKLREQGIGMEALFPPKPEEGGREQG
jgi:hypothetical protein